MKWNRVRSGCVTYTYMYYKTLMIFFREYIFWNTVYTTCLSTHSINDPVSLGISFSTLHNTHKKRKWKIVAIAQGKTIGWKHGLRTPRESFFSKIWIFVAWARVSIQGVLGGLRRFSKIGHWGPVSVPVAQSRKIFWPNYQHYFGTVSPLCIGKCTLFFFLPKRLWFSGLKHITPKYDIGRKELGKEPSHFRLQCISSTSPTVH